MPFPKALHSRSQSLSGTQLGEIQPDPILSDPEYIPLLNFSGSPRVDQNYTAAGKAATAFIDQQNRWWSHSTPESAGPTNMTAPNYVETRDRFDVIADRTAGQNRTKNGQVAILPAFCPKSEIEVLGPAFYLSH